MNLFGLSFSLAKNNGKYVRQVECHKAQNIVKEKIDETRLEIKSDTDKIHKRIDDIFKLLVDR